MNIASSIPLKYLSQSHKICSFILCAIKVDVYNEIPFISFRINVLIIMYLAKIYSRFTLNIYFMTYFVHEKKNQSSKFQRQ